MSVSTLALRDFHEADLPLLIDLWVAAWSETGFAIDFEARLQPPRVQRILSVGNPDWALNPRVTGRKPSRS